MKIFIGDPFNIMDQKALENLQKEKNSNLLFLYELKDEDNMLYHFNVVINNTNICSIPENDYLPTYATSGKYIAVIKNYQMTEQDIFTKSAIILETKVNSRFFIKTEEKDNKLLIVLGVYINEFNEINIRAIIEINLEGGEKDGKNS